MINLHPENDTKNHLHVLWLMEGYFKNFDFDRFTIDTKTLDSAHAL